ncbi:efflux RND transporter periplasmic adaptor subunit [Rhizobium sp. SL42]|uniref:efflux RND transporter periplasmic adaptor subunit n=1 Tax=Rhizobium sp. SL42 TaxID=2806346 RepID=UPI001F002C0F|nr:efflux RND transporter periplasmic adaptor subunit [Rhizobium sp. SL42]UJW76998.1 efflux RND transporter periplasmic adaptor subunit [Rhizobium sp. SL42]
MMRLLPAGILALCFLPCAAHAEELLLRPTPVAEMKAVYGQVEARDSVLARARIGGTVSELKVTEGDLVKAGDVVAVVKDDKLNFQIRAVEAQLLGLNASLNNALLEVERAERLIKSGATTTQRLDQLRTEVDVIRNQIAAAQAQRLVAVAQSQEGDVLAPTAGRVLKVPVTRDAVVLPGEVIVNIGGGGFFLQLAIPERHAAFLKLGTAIRIDAGDELLEGRLAKVYPQIENGRVIADVEVKNISTEFVNARVLVELPVGERLALLVPSNAVETRSGLDFVTVMQAKEPVERVVVTGEARRIDGELQVEVLSGLSAGDVVVIP